MSCCVFAKHDCCNKEFIFSIPGDMIVRKGDILLVNTSKGRTIATATSEKFEGLDVNDIAARFGAYLPLKEVVQEWTGGRNDKLYKLRSSVTR